MNNLSDSGFSNEKAGALFSAQALYIHIPYCLSKCSYCDFYSSPPRTASQGHDPSILEHYGNAVAKELDYHGVNDNIFRDGLRSVYIGGGTPTCLSEGALRNIARGVSSSFKLQSNAEISIEANPGTLDCAKLELLEALGINRLSIGVQSFDDAELRLLGRRHTAQEAIEAIQLARRVGYSNVSIDLIYGLPGQSLESWLHSLNCAISLEVQHISAYCLTVENNTPIAKALTSGRLPRIDDDVAADMMDATLNILESAGYERYEISNYARKGYRSVHNQAYWNYDSYIGVGAGAVGFNGYERYMNIKDDIGYIKCWEDGIVPEMSIERLTEKERMSEASFLGLRMVDGIDIDLWEEKFQVSFMSVYGDAVKGIISRGFGVINQGPPPSYSRFLKLTKAGMAIANTIALDFLL